MVRCGKEATHNSTCGKKGNSGREDDSSRFLLMVFANSGNDNYGLLQRREILLLVLSVGWSLRVVFEFDREHLYLDTPCRLELHAYYIFGADLLSAETG